MRTKENKGFVLITALLVFTALMILVVAFISLSVNQVKQSTDFKNDRQAYYFARSGVDLAIEWLHEFDDFAFYEDDDYNKKVYVYTDMDDLKFEPQNDPDLDHPGDFQISGSIEKIDDEDKERIEIWMKGNNQYPVTVILYGGGDSLGGSNGGVPSFDTPKLSDLGIEGEDYFSSTNNDLEPESWSSVNQITDTGGETYESEKPIAFSATGNNVIQLPNRYSVFMTPEIHFEKLLRVQDGAILKISSYLVVFHEVVELRGNLCFSLPEDSNAEVGYVIFKEGVTDDINLDSGIYSFTTEYNTDDPYNSEYWTCVNKHDSQLEWVEPLEYEYVEKYDSIWN